VNVDVGGARPQLIAEQVSAFDSLLKSMGAYMANYGLQPPEDTKLSLCFIEER
jgi:hypothetical protein